MCVASRPPNFFGQAIASHLRSASLRVKWRENSQSASLAGAWLLAALERVHPSPTAARCPGTTRTSLRNASSSGVKWKSMPSSARMVGLVPTLIQCILPLNSAVLSRDRTLFRSKGWYGAYERVECDHAEALAIALRCAKASPS